MFTITTPVEQSAFKRLFGAGSSWGTIQSVVQPSPDGVAQALLVGDAFLADSPAALVLSDNLFHGQALMSKLDDSNGSNYFELLLDPERYCVVGVL